MEEVLRRVGLPVHCAYSDCKTRGSVRPASVDPEHGGWYKSKFYRFNLKKHWFCPEHYQEGREIDNRFYQNWRTPDPYTAKDTPNIEEELYELLD